MNRANCPHCNAEVRVTAMAALAGSVHCPECGQVVPIDGPPKPQPRPRRSSRRDEEYERPRRRPRSRDDDDYDDGPLPQTSMASGALKLVLVLGVIGALAVVACCVPLGYIIYKARPSGPESSPVPLMQARLGFKTQITQPQNIAEGPAERPPPNTYALVRYPSGNRQLAAYLTPDPKDGKKRPAVIFAHGGFGGIGEDAWEVGSTPHNFLAAGFVVMCPSWRGENDNPGQYEMFYGEIDDAVSAIDYVAQLPYVDPSRIYMVGHSTGGTITLLTAMATTKLRAAFSFGGAPDIGAVLGPFGAGGYGNTPFPSTNKKEQRLRSAIDYVAHLKTPTFYIEGEDTDDVYIESARDMEQRAKKAGAPFSAFIVDGADHFDVVDPICNLIIRKIKADTGGTCNIAFTKPEIQRAFDQNPGP